MELSEIEEALKETSPEKIIVDIDDYELDKQTYRFLYENLKNSYDELLNEHNSLQVDKQNLDRDIADASATIDRQNIEISKLKENICSEIEYLKKYICKDVYVADINASNVLNDNSDKNVETVITPSSDTLKETISMMPGVFSGKRPSFFMTLNSNTSKVLTGAMSSDVQESEVVAEEPIEEAEPATVAVEETPTKTTGLIVASSLDNTMMNMGEYKSIELPSNLTKDSMQKASSNINDNIELNANITSSNAASYSSLKVNKTDTAYTAKTEKLNNAKKIIAYYADNLTELGNLGWKQLQTDAANKDKVVTFDELMSVDFKASATQLETIKAGDGARLTISSDKFEDGATYFVVHESETRTGIYDILLTRSNGNTLDITVPDLSPVTIAKVSISDNNNSAQETTTTAPVELEVKKDNGGKVMAVTILFIIAIIALGALFIMAKKRNNGTNPFKRK